MTVLKIICKYLFSPILLEKMKALCEIAMMPLTAANLLYFRRFSLIKFQLDPLVLGSRFINCSSTHLEIMHHVDKILLQSEYLALKTKTLRCILLLE